MNLLPLDPAVTKLRRTARACAAGELSRYEYRLARREVIEQFVGTPQSRSDQTMPRRNLDVTQRRPAAPPSDECAREEQGFRWWLLVCLLFVCALLLPGWVAADAAPGSEIPALAERDPNPSTARRYIVDEIVWEAPAAFDAAQRDAAAAFLAQRLRLVRESNQAADHGFSPAELAEVGRYLDALGIHDPKTRITRADVEDLVGLVASQKARRGISTVELERIAGELQAWVRERGYPVAVAYVPSQSVTAGRVALEVQLGRLAGVVVQDSEQAAVDSRDRDSISRRFTGLLGKTVEREALETELNALNRTPGLQTSASFGPGPEVGDTELNLIIKRNSRGTGSVQLDNHGLREIGEERLVLSGVLTNLRELGDRLGVDAYGTLDGGDQVFANVSYQTRLMPLGFDLQARVGYGDLSIDENFECGINRGRVRHVARREHRGT